MSPDLAGQAGIRKARATAWSVLAAFIESLLSSDGLIRSAKQGHLRIDDQLARRSFGCEVEGSFGTGREDGSETNEVARARLLVDRNAGDEGARDAGLKEFPANHEPICSRVSGEFDAVAGNAGAAHVLFEKPFHGAATFEIHRRSHHGLDFTLQIVGGESAVSVLRGKSAKKLDEARVGIFGGGLAQHLADHVNDPRTLGVNQLIEAGGRLGRVEALAERERANIVDRLFRAGKFFEKLFAVAFEPKAKLVVIGPSALRKQQSEIIGDSLVNPLIAVARPAHDVTPPLMRDLVIRNNVRESFLAGRVEPRAVLRLRS